MASTRRVDGVGGTVSFCSGGHVTVLALVGGAPWRETRVSVLYKILVCLHTLWCAGKTFASVLWCRLEGALEASGNTAALRKAAAGVYRKLAPLPTRNQQVLLAAAAKHDCRTHPRRKLTRTAWTVALHLYPWGAAQQIPRESRQDARTGVLWGRRAKRRQPSRPPVNRARHSQVPTDAARPKNTSAAARKKTSTNHPRDEEKLTTSRRGLDV